MPETGELGRDRIMGEDTVWLPVKDASRVLNMTENALRVRKFRGKIGAQKNNKGELLIEVPQKRVKAYQEQESGNITNSTNPIEARIKRDYAAELQEQLEIRIDEKQTEIDELKKELKLLRDEHKKEVKETRQETIKVLDEIEKYKEDKSEELNDLYERIGRAESSEAKYNELSKQVGQLLTRLGIK